MSTKPFIQTKKCISNYSNDGIQLPFYTLSLIDKGLYSLQDVYRMSHLKNLRDNLFSILTGMSKTQEEDSRSITDVIFKIKRRKKILQNGLHLLHHSKIMKHTTEIATATIHMAQTASIMRLMKKKKIIVVSFLLW